jgi:hypothetical protein
MTKVMIEVETGSRSWAMAMYDAGREVEYPTYHGPEVWERVTPYEYRSIANEWRLYVEPPQPITVQPGTFPWAMAQLRAGKQVRRQGILCVLSPNNHICRNLEVISRGSFEATDWEVVE